MRPLRLALIFAAAGCAAAQELPPLKHVSPAPQQPIPFSHRTHISKGLECKQCHPVPEPGDFAEIAGTGQCMACHTSIKSESPAIQKLAAFQKKGEDVPWEPVYLIPSYVFFNHSVHITKAGAECESCHGPVGELKRWRRSATSRWPPAWIAIALQGGRSPVLIATTRGRRDRQERLLLPMRVPRDAATLAMPEPTHPGFPAREPALLDGLRAWPTQYPPSRPTLPAPAVS